MSGGARKEPQERLTRLIFWVALIAAPVLLTATWFLAATFEGDAYERSFAVFASFAASAFWWAFLARLVERETLAFVKTEIEKERTDAERHRATQNELLQSALDRYAHVGDGIPAAVYPGKNHRDLRYNQDLDAHLSAATQYVFHGPTAVYVGARLMLRQGDQPLHLVEVMLTDPTSEGAMRVAVEDRMQRPDHIGKDPVEIAAELRDDIFMAIIALFDARVHADQIRVMHERRARARIELFDAAVYEATVGSTERKNFTHTLRWDTGSVTYRSRAQELRRMHETSRHRVVFATASREPALISHLEALGLDTTRLGELRERYQTRYVEKLERMLEQARAFSDELRDDDLIQA